MAAASNSISIDKNDKKKGLLRNVVTQQTLFGKYGYTFLRTSTSAAVVTVMVSPSTV